MKYLDYAKAFNANEEVQFWVSHNLENFLKDHPEDQDEIEHIIDYLVSEDAPKRLKSMSYEEADKNAEKWTKSQHKKGQHITEKPEDTEVVLDFKDGFKIVKLVGKNAYEREGYLMRHCVASYYGNSAEIYSLRDKDNIPHCTMEKDQQIKGKGNGDIHPKYVEYVVKFLEYTGMTVGDNEMRHLGYINMKKFKKELSKDTKYFNKVYLPANEKLLDREGKEYASLDLWDVRPLVIEQNDTLKINFELPTFIKLSFEYMQKSIKVSKTEKVSFGNYSKNASSGDSSKNASSGYASTNASSGYASTNASSGNASTNASSGYASTNASSGNASTNASSGDSSKNASSGYSSKNASSGNYSTNASSGDDSKNASSGYASKNASSGYSSKNASSGNYSTNASSGDDSKNASSGNYSKNEMKGNYSVSVDAGHDGKAKGKIGCWFCLSEWKKDGDIWKPVCVKAVQIDGKKIKEDTWYRLENGKFVE